MARFVFRFVLGLFFQKPSVFNNFSGLFLALFSFVFWPRSFIFSNFSALFFKKGILFYFSAPRPTKKDPDLYFSLRFSMPQILPFPVQKQLHPAGPPQAPPRSMHQ
jgi:hypothetical protein